MSDRTSAALFKMLFEHLAQTPDDRNTKFAKLLWKSTYDYDFSPPQIGADAALTKLGLCQKLKCGCIVYEGQTHDEGYC